MLQACRKGSKRTRDRGRLIIDAGRAPEKGSRVGQVGRKHLGRAECLGAKKGPSIPDSKENKGCSGAQGSCEQKEKDSEDAVGPSDGCAAKRSIERLEQGDGVRNETLPKNG